MKNFAFAIFIMSFGITAGAQKVFFFYLQAETRAPFYVRLADKVFSSSTSGYLILPNLKDSAYNFSIGYTGAKVAESRFAIPVEGTDKGFLLKEFEYGPGLFDMQTLVIHKPVTAATQQQQTTTRTDSFTRRLAKAADDESLLTVPVVAKLEAPKPKEPQKEPTAELVKVEPIAEEKKEVTKVVDTLVTTVAKTEPVKVEEKHAEQAANPVITQKEPEVKQQDTLTAAQLPIVKSEVTQEKSEPQSISEEPFKRSAITRRSESSTTEGFGLVYLDVHEWGTDTIRLLIPNQKKVVVIEDMPPVIEPVQQIVADVPTKDPTKQTSLAHEKRNNSCNNVATEKDFLKLRKNMAAETNDEEMIAEARKYFKIKCFTTEQVRNLSPLFLTNAAKYQFFDAAYQYVSDLTLFPSLSSELKDEYYSKRFKALIGE